VSDAVCLYSDGKPMTITHKSTEIHHKNCSQSTIIQLHANYTVVKIHNHAKNCDNVCNALACIKDQKL